MRISTNMLYDLGVGGIQQQTSALIKTQQQVATGRRILTPQDDPVGAARVLEVSQSKSLNEQYDVNTDSATSSLGLEESALASIGSLIQDARTLAINAGNPTLDHNNLASLATDLRGRYQELLGIANSTDGNGQYMFSGYKGSTTPFAETAPGSVVYNGDQGQRLMQISPSRQIAVSDAGADVFMQIKNGNGTFVTAASTANTGSGLVSPGTVLDPALWNVAANSKNFTIRFDVNSAASPAVTTYDIVDNVSGNSLLTGTPAAAAGPYLRTYTSGSAISLKTQAPPDTTATPFDYGAELDIQGAPADGDTFTVNASTNESIFTTLNNLITSLETANVPGNQTALMNNLNTALSNLDNGLDQVLTVRASVGARMKEIDSVKSAGEDTALQYDQTLSNLQDLDYAKAITDLTRQQTGLEAAQKSFLKVQGLSLFNYI
jgi:flagellar hook-associated protein 3 FlgL